MNIKIIERRLRKDHDLPEAFAFYRWECFPKNAGRVIYVELEGGVCPKLKSGKNKGRPNYAKATFRRTFQITTPEADQWGDDYATETGNCPSCMGEGRLPSRFGVNIETEYRECSKCKGAGTMALTPA